MTWAQYCTCRQAQPKLDPISRKISAAFIPQFPTMPDSTVFRARSTNEASRSTAFRGFLKKLMNSSNYRTLPRKLASTPFAASLLVAPLSPDEVFHRREHLQRIVDITVLDATRDKKKEIVITLKSSLKPKAPREQVGIFVPNNSPGPYQTTLTFRDVNQLNKILTFCVDKTAGDCDENCKFYSRLRTYLRNHWIRDPLVAVANMGDTVLRKPSLVLHLARLVAFTTGKTPCISKENGVAVVQLVPQLSPLGQQHQMKTDAVDVCAVQNEVAVVLYNFFAVFSQESAPASFSSILTKEL